MKPRICVITAGHLSTCPRMLKAADALAEAGYQARMVSTRHMPWAWQADQDARRTRSWHWTVVNYERRTALPTYAWSGLRYRAASAWSKTFSPAGCPLGVAARAFGRVHSELVRAAVAEPADLYYGGTTGGLAAAAEAARRARKPYALDLEDFHSAEHEDTPDNRLHHGLAERIERAVLPGASFLTAGSDAIADAYHDKYGLRPTPVHNTFPLPSEPPQFQTESDDQLRLYWFSQTIGPGRGLEDVVDAMSLGDIGGELHLRGRPLNGYLEHLRQRASARAPQLHVCHHDPAPPDAMIDLCRQYDVGLALEPGRFFNSAVCLSNKALTYMLAGLAVAFSDTPGQHPLASNMEEAAVSYSPGDAAGLAAGLKRWATDKAALACAKKAAWSAAVRRWHWEHPLERGALLAAVEKVFA